MTESTPNYITEIELYKKDITHSTIGECVIKRVDEVISDTNASYIGVLDNIWDKMGTDRILQNSSFNFKFLTAKNEEGGFIKNGEKGYHWRDMLGMFVQNRNANRTLKEIIQMVKLNQYTIKLRIKLKTGEPIHFKID